MGAVYRANQRSLDRVVALKVIRAGLLAGESEVERFQREAKAAAQLQHPNIVHVLEQGVCNGQHYYSMEFIDGQNLAEMVRDQPLSAMQAAVYLRDVAQGIHFAHQQGTIHRDLKPTNILIDRFDDPRITDFGVAWQKGLDPHLTLTGQMLGTPAFAPPEQADSQADVGPPADVYSVGAILYYVLTQKPPFTAASLTDLLLLVRVKEPVPPRSLNPSVPRDLETICLKCLEKDSHRRYGSADDLANDLQRFIRGEPILARPISRTARAWRWCGRNPAWAAAVCVLLAGASISTWQAIRATRAEREQTLSRLQAESAAKTAKAAARKSEQTAQFLKDMLNGVGPSVALGRDTRMLSEILDQTAERVGKGLKDQPDVQADLQSTIGIVYADLGQYEKAEQMHRSVLATVTKLWGPEHLDVASALDNLAAALQNQGKLTEAEELDLRALAMRRKLLGDAHPDVAFSLENLGQVLGLQGNLPEAEAKAGEALAIQRKLYGTNHLDVATTLQNLAQTIRMEGKLSQAEAMESEALAIRRRLLGSEHPDVATSLNGLGIVLAEEGKVEEAEARYREALALRRKFLGNDHPGVAESLNNLANLLQGQDKYSEAESMHREALRVERKLLGDGHPAIANSLNNLALVLRDEGKLADAESMEREALGMWKKLHGEDHFLVAKGINNMASIYRDQGRLTEAEQLQRSALTMQKKLLAGEHPDIARSLHNLAEILHRQGQEGEAETLFRDALAMRRSLLGNEHADVAASLEGCASVLQTQHKLDEAEVMLRESLSIREKKPSSGWRTFSVSCTLGGDLLAQKKYAEAEKLLLSGYQGLKQRQNTMPAAQKTCMIRAVEQLITLYGETAKTEKVADWKRTLAELGAQKSETKAANSPPEK